MRLDPLQEELNNLDNRVEKLRVLYEKYFLGIDRVPPTNARDSIKRDMVRAREKRMNGAAWKFKLDSITTKLRSYEQYWDRVCREIEDGVYYRDRYKMNLRKELAKKSGTGSEEAPELPPVRPVPAQVAPAATPVEASSSVPKAPGVLEEFGLNEARLGKLHTAYLQARQKAGDTTEALSREQLAVNLVQELSDIKQTSGTRDLEFRLKLKAGRVRVAVSPKGTAG